MGERDLRSLCANDMHADNIEAQAQAVAGNRKWTSFWVLLKFMCVYYHRVIVPRKRKCFGCSVDRLRKRRSAGDVREKASYDEELDPLVAHYEYGDSEGSGMQGTDANQRVSHVDRAESDCPVCETLWWNQDGETEKYTEQDIGIGLWNHPGSGTLSSLMLLGALTLIIYDVVCFMLQLWGQPDLILRLMIKATLYIIILLYPVLSLCSKLRSLLSVSAPSLQWASALNARYLVKRAQFLDIGRKGLPGKALLSVCTLTPLLTAFYRCLIFTVISECGFNLPTILTSIVGFIFNESFGLYLYLFYVMRVSFQRQFNLLILYIKDNEGDESRCRGALYSVAVDFNCFKRLVNLSIFIMFPAMVFAISGNLTIQYMIVNVPCIVDDPTKSNVSHNTLRLAWAEILLSLGTYLVAIGGIQVEYVFNKFVDNLMHLRSSSHQQFWNNLLKDIDHVSKDSYFFLVTIIFSFISIFMAFNFSNQDVTDLVFCNGTIHEDLCV